MLAKSVDKPFDSAKWIFEIKWDGFRAIADLRKKNTQLYSRNGGNFDKAYPEIFESLKKIKKGVVLDGEIVALDQRGRPQFSLMRDRGAGAADLVYYVFDLLYLDGNNVMGWPLNERKKALKKIIPKLKNVRYSDHIIGKGIKFFQNAKKAGLEGVMAKEGSSKYIKGERSQSWLKIKNNKIHEAIICGYTSPSGGRKRFGALLLGVYENGVLRYAGDVGTGFSDRIIEEIYQKLNKIRVKSSPFGDGSIFRRQVNFVKPRYVCEIQYTEWIGSGKIRHSSFKGLRNDKKPSEVTREV